jgi:hypothetical protein
LGLGDFDMRCTLFCAKQRLSVLNVLLVGSFVSIERDMFGLRVETNSRHEVWEWLETAGDCSEMVKRKEA